MHSNTLESITTDTVRGLSGLSGLSNAATDLPTFNSLMRASLDKHVEYANLYKQVKDIPLLADLLQEYGSQSNTEVIGECLDVIHQLQDTIEEAVQQYENHQELAKVNDQIQYLKTTAPHSSPFHSLQPRDLIGILNMPNSVMRMFT